MLEGKEHLEEGGVLYGGGGVCVGVAVERVGVCGVG